MKCSFCSYNHKPDNPQFLKAHAELDILEGKTGGVVPVVVWRDGEFLLVSKENDGETVYSIGLVDPRPLVEDEETIRKRREYDASVTKEEEEVVADTPSES
jgi:hypothetical protein